MAKDDMFGGIDPATLQPVERQLEIDAAEAAKKEKDNLEATASWLAVAESETANRLLIEIEKKLTERIEVLCKADPVAGMLLDLMQTLGRKHNISRRAMQTLQRKYYRLQEEDKQP